MKRTAQSTTPARKTPVRGSGRVLGAYTGTESQLVTQICDYLALRKHFYYRNNNIPVFDSARGAFRKMPAHSRKGVPDIVVVRDGYIGLEVKLPKGKQSPDQKLFEKQCKEAGGEYYVVHNAQEVQDLGL